MRRGILAFLFFGNMINFADKSIVGYAAVPIMKEFNLSFTEYGLVSSSFFWLFMFGGVFGSTLADRLGTKKMLAILLIAWTFIQSSSFLINGLYGLIVMRVMLGAFEGPFSPTANNHVSKWFQPERLSSAVSVVNAGAIVGGLFLAPVIVFCIEKLGWRQTFGALALISLVWVILWMWLAKDKPRQENLVQSETKSETKMKWSEIYPVLLCRPFLLVCGLLFANYWLGVWVTTFLPAYLVKAIHLTPTDMGYFSLIMGIFSCILTILIALFSDRLFMKNNNLRKSRVLVGGLCSIFAGLLFYSITFIHNPIYILVAMILGKGMVSANFVMWVPIATSLMPLRKGLILGVGTGCAQAAGIIGPIMTGAIVQFAGNNQSLGFDYSILFMGSLLVFSGLIYALFCKPDKYAKVHPSENKAAIPDTREVVSS